MFWVMLIQTQALACTKHLLTFLRSNLDQFFLCGGIECRMRAKLGLLNSQYDADRKLIEDLLDTMRTTAADFTTTFKLLEEVNDDSVFIVLPFIYRKCGLKARRKH